MDRQSTPENRKTQYCQDVNSPYLTYSVNDTGTAIKKNKNSALQKTPSLLSQILKELLKVNKKTKSLIKKWAKNLNRYFTKEDIQRADKHMRRCSTSYVIQEMQIKTTTKYHYIPVRMAMIQKNTTTKC